MHNRLCWVLGLVWTLGCGGTTPGEGTITSSGTSSSGADSGSDSGTSGSSTGSSGAIGSSGSSGSTTSSGTSTGGTSGTSCGALAPPEQAAGCTCRPGHTCTANGCFGGYWCNSSNSQCIAPPSNCGSTATSISTGSTGALPSCANRPAGVTELDAEVRVDRYRGIVTGPSGPHEDFDGTITQILQVADASVVDTNNVSVAMNVSSNTDPTGLPHEIKLKVGDSVRLIGEYIPKSTASAHTAAGAAAVIHFTHSPCGSATLGGVTYQ